MVTMGGMAADFDEFLADVPLLHFWGGQWRRGGFNPATLRAIHDVIAGHEVRTIIETGAGNSTLTFLYAGVETVVSIAPDADLRDRIVGWAKDHGLDAGPLDYRVERSEVELPRLVLEDPALRFDAALIDGGHGWPTVFVDFAYCNALLPKDGLLLVDDLQLYAVAELDRLLAEQPGWELERDLGGKLHVWRKTNDARWLPDHAAQPYVTRMNPA
jgi:hypothetical protein